MNKRESVLALVALCAAPLAARAQQADAASALKKVAWYGGTKVSKALVAAYETRLAERGWRNGQSVTLRLFRSSVLGSSSSTTSREMEEAIAELLEWRPDVIVAGGQTRALALKRANPSVPIVFYQVVDPVEAGLVASLRQPGGNFTGVTNGDDVLAIKRLEITRELLPNARRVAVVYSKANEAALKSLFLEMQEAATRLGLQLAMVVIRPDGVTAKELIANIQAVRVHAVIPVGELALSDPKFNLAEATRALLDSQAKAPFIDNDLYSVEGGFLIAVGEVEADRIRRVADITASILSGTKPGSIPVDQVTRIQMWINNKTAKALGVKIPHSILVRADRVFE